MKVIITGGAGFIGTNTAREMARTDEVVIVDNMSRPGAQENLSWLLDWCPDVQVYEQDIRDAAGLKEVVAAHQDVELIIHLAGQVAVTTSVQDPVTDFNINALGTLNLLEAVRTTEARPLIIFASTNKVYGGLETVPVGEEATRYVFEGLPHGVPETMPIDFHSPYGCSKGAADQYVRDYSRIYGLDTVVLRQSCIYGPHQLGVEDQGWVAWFLIAIELGRKITIYGNGKQVRDLLHVQDLVRLYRLCSEKRDVVNGKVYNVGGGPDFSVSIWAEFGELVREATQAEFEVDRGDWRPGDQPIYISDIRRVNEDVGWAPEISPQQGIRELREWVLENREMLDRMFR